jgi:hypothetical protein
MGQTKAEAFESITGIPLAKGSDVVMDSAAALEVTTHDGSVLIKTEAGPGKMVVMALSPETARQLADELLEKAFEAEGS